MDDVLPVKAPPQGDFGSQKSPRNWDDLDLYSTQDASGDWHPGWGVNDPHSFLAPPEMSCEENILRWDIEALGNNGWCGANHLWCVFFNATKYIFHTRFQWRDFPKCSWLFPGGYDLPTSIFPFVGLVSCTWKVVRQPRHHCKRRHGLKEKHHQKKPLLPPSTTRNDSPKWDCKSLMTKSKVGMM